MNPNFKFNVDNLNFDGKGDFSEKAKHQTLVKDHLKMRQDRDKAVADLRELQANFDLVSAERDTARDERDKALEAAEDAEKCTNWVQKEVSCTNSTLRSTSYLESARADSVCS